MNVFGLGLYLTYTFGWIPVCIYLLIKRAKGYVLVSAIASGVIFFSYMGLIISIEPSLLPIINAAMAGVVFMISLIVLKTTANKKDK
ncbi:MAG: hypothetical protein P3T54_05635 [Dehalogenimonas sp.]|uniref:Uncharacterized protein n=1 Tax=Candidatus Dehalogenimonas loeffleri TaxID=3127115 RepID=A0ABZ2J6I3_9CHLR|nr:hypothetical protein [Dehalogenimonas sp.]